MTLATRMSFRERASGGRANAAQTDRMYGASKYIGALTTTTALTEQPKIISLSKNTLHILPNHIETQHVLFVVAGW